jgi:hypothetical protein
MSIFGETNTIIDDIEPSVLDNDTDQVLSNDTDQVLSNVLEKKKPGKKKNNVWDHFTEDTRKKGHSSSICKFCGESKARGRPSEMMAHLALQCDKVEASVKEKYLKTLAQVNQTSESTSFAKLPYTKGANKRKLNEDIASGIQPKITSKLQKSTIDPGQQALCNKSLTRFFVCCGIPFSTVESPFFIDLVKNLCASYQLPDRRTLSNTWLDNETARIVVEVEEILKRQENLSLGIYIFIYL